MAHDQHQGMKKTLCHLQFIDSISVSTTVLKVGGPKLAPCSFYDKQINVISLGYRALGLGLFFTSLSRGVCIAPPATSKIVCPIQMNFRLN